MDESADLKAHYVSLTTEEKGFSGTEMQRAELPFIHRYELEAEGELLADEMDKPLGTNSIQMAQ